MDNKKYEVFDYFIFRSPALPYSFLNKFIKDNSVEDVFFDNILENNIVKEALFLASPGLLEELQRLSKNDGKDENYLHELRISLAKYMLRMASRCTPFGLFAGFSLGEFGENTAIILKGIDEYSSHTRFDMNYLVALSQDLIKNEVIKKSIRYFPNSSLNRVRNKIRYVEYKYVKTERTHNIVSVDNSEYLEKILKTAEKGACIKELGELITDEEIFYETAEAFVNELIDSQLLISEIEPSITGDEYLHQLLDILRNITGIEDIINTLKSAHKCIEEIDNAKLGDSADKYIPLSEMIKPLGTEFKINYLFQTDMYKPCISSILSKKTAEDVLCGVDFLSKLTFEPSETNLSKFVERFEKKYGEKEVCILEALDPESGIGFLQSSGSEDSSPLLEKLPVRMYSQTSDRIYWNKTIALLDKKIFGALSANESAIELSDEDVKNLDSKLEKLAPTFCVVAKITGKNDKGEDQIFISSAGGSSSAYLLGRFCHADKETDDFVKMMVKKEEEILKDFIVAEIVHLPQARVGNVLLHPQFHEYEIPYLARSNSDSDHQIQLDDIFLSLYGKKLIMRSKKLNKIIIPRLSNAHNFSFNAQPIYQFLCEMQYQDIIRGVNLPLGNAIERYGHIPRIVYKNIILHLAEWKVKKKEVESFSKIKNCKELINQVTEWRKKRRIPKLVMLEEGDNTLLINLENSFCINMLLSSLKGDEFKIKEFLFDEKTANVRSHEGAFLNEFVISYFRNGI